MTMERRETKGMWFVWTAALALGSAVMGCSTEVELNAPYDSIPVVFGLLELEADTQWVKINRTWLGEGDQFEAAAIADSSLYPEGSVEAWMVELIPSSSGVVTGDELPTGREWALSETTLDNREPDTVFTWTEHRVFFAETSDEALEEDKLYKLELRLPDGKEATATTTLVSGTGSISFPPASPNYELNLATVNPVTGLAQYSDLILRWNAANGARLYTLAMIVNYREIVYTDESWTTIESETDRSLTISLGSYSVNNVSDGETCNRSFNTESIYTELASRLEYNPRIRRVFGEYDPLTSKSRALDFVLQVANQDLATYMDVNQVSTSIVQDRPTWSNIQLMDPDGSTRSGVGLWASRSVMGLYGIAYSKQSIQHLVEGDLTAGLNFCSPAPSGVSDYSCD